MKKQLLLLLIFSISLYVQGQNIHKLASPDGNIQISVNLSDKIYYDVICRNETLLSVTLQWKSVTRNWERILK